MPGSNRPPVDQENAAGAGARGRTDPLTLDLAVMERVHGYDDLAALLGVDRAAARTALREAIDRVVGPRLAAPDLALRLAILDYLLGEQTMPERTQTRAALDDSSADRAWANEARIALGFVMQRPLAPVPNPTSGLTQEFQALSLQELDRTSGAASSEPADAGPPPALGFAGSRVDRGGRVHAGVRGAQAIVAISLLAAIVVAVVVVAGSGGHHAHAVTRGRARHTATRGQVASRRATRSGTRGTVARTLQHLTLHPTSVQPRAAGVAAVVSQGGSLLLLMEGSGLKPNRGDYYGVWLYNTEADAELLGLISPPVGRSGRFSSGTTLPDDAVRFHELIVAVQREAVPTRPGRQILQSPLSVQ